MSGKTELLQTVIGRNWLPPSLKERVDFAKKVAKEEFALSPEDISCMAKAAGYDPRFAHPEMKMPTLWTLPQRLVERVAEIGMDGFEIDRRHFWKLLVALTPHFDRQPFFKTAAHLPSPPQIDMLDIGCGKGTDAIPLQSYFGRMPYGLPSGNVRYIGIDILESEIKTARALHQDRPDLHFEAADATRLDAKPFLQKRFDVIVIRHPEVFVRYGPPHIHPLWFKIYKEAVEHLVPGGILLVTNYRKKENVATRETMQCLGLKEVFAGKNPFGVNDQSFYLVNEPRDQYVTIFTK